MRALLALARDVEREPLRLRRHGEPERTDAGDEALRVFGRFDGHGGVRLREAERDAAHVDGQAVEARGGRVERERGFLEFGKGDLLELLPLRVRDDDWLVAGLVAPDVRLVPLEAERARGVGVDDVRDDVTRTEGRELDGRAGRIVEHLRAGEVGGAQMRDGRRAARRQRQVDLLPGLVHRRDDLFADGVRGDDPAVVDGDGRRGGGVLADVDRAGVDRLLERAVGEGERGAHVASAPVVRGEVERAPVAESGAVLEADVDGLARRVELARPGGVAGALVVDGEAVAHHAVLQHLGGVVGLEVDAGRGRRAERLAHDGVLDEEVLGGDHADALAVVAVAEHVADHHVHVAAHGAAAAEVDAVAAGVREREALDAHVAAAEDAEGMAPFGLLVGRLHVVLVPHAQRRAVAHDVDVRATEERQQARALGAELAGLRLDFGAGFEDELQVRRALEGRDDPGRRHLVDDEPRDAGRERGLERRGGVGGVESPPGGARLRAGAGADLRDEIGTGFCGSRERAREGAQCENDFFHGV